jgi:hypothetical protein
VITVSTPTQHDGDLPITGEPTSSEHLLVTPSLAGGGPVPISFSGRWTVTVRHSGVSVSKFDFSSVDDARDLAGRLHALGLDWAALGASTAAWPGATKRAVLDVLTAHLADLRGADEQEVDW